MKKPWSFNRKSLGATVDMMMRFKENPEQNQSATVDPEKILHAAFRVGQSVLLASDGHCTGKSEFKGFALSLTMPNAEEAEKAFAALADGGQIRMPLTKTFFSPRFGMVADRFGVAWMVYVVG